MANMTILSFTFTFLCFAEKNLLICVVDGWVGSTVLDKVLKNNVLDAFSIGTGGKKLVGRMVILLYFEKIPNCLHIP